MIKKTLMIIASVLAMPLVAAQQSNNFPPDIFTNIIQMIFSGDLDTTYQRFIIFLVAFSIFYIGAKLVFGNRSNSGAPITISLMLGLMATLAMPESLVNSIFNMYSGLFGAILLFGPSIIILALTFRTFKSNNIGALVAQSLVFIIVGLIFTSENLLNQIPILDSIGIAEYMAFTGWILILIGIWRFIKIFGHTKVGGSVGNSINRIGDSVSDGISKKVEKTMGNWVEGLGETSAAQQKTSEAVTKGVQQTSSILKEEIKDFKELNDELNKLVPLLNEWRAKNMDKSIANKIVNIFKTIKSSIDKTQNIVMTETSQKNAIIETFNTDLETLTKNFMMINEISTDLLPDSPAKENLNKDLTNFNKYDIEKKIKNIETELKTMISNDHSWEFNEIKKHLVKLSDMVTSYLSSNNESYLNKSINELEWLIEHVKTISTELNIQETNINKINNELKSDHDKLQTKFEKIIADYTNLIEKDLD